MGGLRIALDLDGVLADATDNWMGIVRERFGISLEKSQIDEWSFWNNLGMVEEQFDEIFSEAWRNWETIKETEENLSEKVERLTSLGELEIVTGRSRETIGYVTKWMSRKGINCKKIVLVGTHSPKAHLDYHIFIDDSPLHVSDAADRGKVAILYDQPWNRKLPERENLIRVKSLLEASEIIEQRSNGFDGGKMLRRQPKV